MEISLAGKVAIVTGASSGIGLATVQRLLECKITGLVAVFRPGESALELRELAKRTAALELIEGDVAQEDTAVRYTGTALDRFGRIDVVISNAGVSVVRALHEHTPEEWNRVMDTNVKALFWSARHVIPVMIGQRSGLFLLTGSISGEAGIPTQGAYAASKGALHQMTRQMAIEYAPYGIRVNTVACGTVDTPIVHASAKASGDEQGYWNMLRRNHPIGRIASADEVGAFFAYLASDYATFFTGAVLMMDGGYTAQ